MSLSRSLRRHGLFAATILALATACSAASAAPPALALVQNATGGEPIQLNVYIDQRRNRAEISRITEDVFPGYAYTQVNTGDRSQLRLASNELVRLWKGGGTITPKSGELFESADQFLPVLLLIDVTNDGTQPTQINGSFLEVATSQSDLQPLIVMGGLNGPTCSVGRTPNFQLTNAGWGRAENAQITFAFGRDRPTTENYQLPLGALGIVDVSLARATAQLAPRLEALRRRPPTCPSTAQLPQCLARLEREGALGGFAGLVKVREGGEVVSHLTGVLDYSWRDAAGAVQTQRSPIETDLPLFFIEANGPECGAGAPGEGGFRPVKLALDRSNYTIALPYRGRLGARGNRRLELALVADKASRHLFRVVLELADGRRVASAPMELSYFTPRMPQGEPRPVR